MFDKPIKQIKIEDLNELIQNSVAEGKEIEYKEMFPGNSDSDKKEFLADISSFSNTIGGYLIFGIKEEKGVPISIVGVNIPNIDEVIRKFENAIRDGIEPRIQPIIHIVELENNNKVFIIRISKSWVGPHRVIFKGHDKFYARNSAGKYPIDTMELRTSFNLSETLVDKIKKFRLERMAELIANRTPIPFYEGGKIILHLIPLASFSPSTKYRIDQIAENPAKLQPIYCSGWNHRYNLEGFLTYSGGRKDDNRSHSYVQLYRNGIIEAVEGLMLSKDREKLYIPSVAYEKELLKSLPKFLATLKELNITPPVFIFLTLAGIKGYEMAVDRSRFDDEYYKIDRDILTLPESLIENYDIDPEDILRPMFDLIWNACGFSRSFNFDENGNWIAK